MATELHLSNNPIHSVKRHLREIKSGSDSNEALLKAVIESNIHTQQAVAEVSRNINDFVTLLKSVGDEEPKEQKAAYQKISIVEQKLDKIATQNLQLILVISELVKHLRRDKPAQPAPQYTGIYPMRPVQ